MKLPCLVFIFALLADGAPRAAAAAFTSESAVRHALANNADLAAARLTVEEARGRLAQAGRLANPELESELKPNVRGREGVLAFGLTQRFPLTARLRLEKAVSRAELAVAEAEVRDAERRLAAEVALAAVDWLALGTQRELKERQLANSRELVEAANRAAGVGEGSALEAAQFDLEAQQLVTQLLQLDTGHAALLGELRPLLGVPAPEPIEITGTLPEVAVVGTEAVALSRRADHQAALARREAAERALALARANRWQDLGVGLLGEMERAEDIPAGIQQDNFVGLRLSLPLPFWNRNQGRVQEATATAQRRVKESEALAFRIRAEVEAAERQMAVAARLAGEVTATLLRKASQLEERLAKLRAEGQASLADVLRARERRLQLESTRMEAVRDFHRARVRLDIATGAIVPSPKIP